MSILSLLAGALLAAQGGAPFPKAPLSLGTMPDVGGVAHTLPVSGAKATVIMAISHDCPIANRYAPEIARIAEEFGKNGFKFFRVYFDKGVGVEGIRSHGKEYGLKFPALWDVERKLVEAIGFRVTPEVAVVGADSKLLYRGRIDGQNIEHGRIQEGYRRDLRMALGEILEGKKVSVPETTAIGCFLPPPDRSPRASS
jgi:hypothetical protein